MNKRIRKKREQQQTAQAIRQLTACYRQWEQEREEKYRRLEAKYGIALETDPQHPFGLPLARFPAGEVTA